MILRYVCYGSVLTHCGLVRPYGVMGLSALGNCFSPEQLVLNWDLKTNYDDICNLSIVEHTPPISKRFDVLCIVVVMFCCVNT